MSLGEHATKEVLEVLVPQEWVAGGYYSRDMIETGPNSSYAVNTGSKDLHYIAKQIVVDELLKNIKSDIKTPLSRDARGRRNWPEGFVGSTTDKRSVILAAMADEDELESIGIDLELTEGAASRLEYVVDDGELPPSMPDELSVLAGFSVKEAVFKAYYQLEESVIDFGDIILDWKNHDSETGSGIAKCPNNRKYIIRCSSVDDWVVTAAFSNTT